MKVLSLFDGMSCGMLAMMDAGIDVSRYVAYEIDKYASQTSLHNFPSIEQQGDVFEANFQEYEGFDYLIGGSPCTYWSIAQTKHRETVASGLGWELFSQYVRALNEAKPRYFLYENNKSMSRAIRDSIVETFGFEPVCVNSALVSAQNRNRLYWVGERQEDGTYKRVEIEEPRDEGILLRDILEGTPHSYLTEKNVLHLMRDFGSKGKIVGAESKTPTLCAAAGTSGGNGIYYGQRIEGDSLPEGTPTYEVRDRQIDVLGVKHPSKLPDGIYAIRKLSVEECKRLQTVPDWYEFPVSDSRAYKMLGNGWTVKVISFLLSHTT